ncbi:MAG: hypothetical protein ACQEWV_12010 [Bacillota bacterium]
MKIQIGLLAIMLIMLTIPSITLAKENTTIVEQQNQSKDWQEKGEKRKKEILQIVEKNSPEKLDEWKEAIATRDGLLSKIDKDEWHKHSNGKQWKIIKQKKREAMRALREAAKSGDEEKVDKLLNKMLAKLKEYNQKLQEKTS